MVRLTDRVCSLLVISATLLACGEQRANARQHDVGDTLPERPSLPQAQARVLYYGADTSGEGWLVHVDFERQEGVRYFPLENIGLCNVRKNPNGTVSWSSSPRFEVIERFQGEPRPGGLRGVITYIRETTGQVTRTSDVDLDSAAFPMPAGDTVSDVYSSVKYIQRAGDLSGAEVLILRFARDPLVLLTTYEGAASGPWAMTDVRWAGDTLSGAYGSPRPFRITFVRVGASLRDIWGTVLRRGDGLKAVLVDKPHTPCSGRR